MRSHAKAPSAFTHGRIGLIALAFAMTFSLWLVNATGASAAPKYYDSTIGTTSALAGGFPPSPASTNYGGFFSTGNGGIGDVAVNDPDVDDGNGADGFIYVVDRGNNRVQAFGADGSFKWTIGRDVVAPSVNEAQLLNVDATAGQFKLKFGADTTIDFAWNVSAATIQTELRKLPSLGGPAANTSVVVTGTAATATVPGRYAIAFTGTGFAATNQSPIEVQPGTTALTGTAQITTQADGTAATPGDQGVGFEKCTVSGHCKAGATGGLGGEMNVVQGIVVNQITGDIFVRERSPNARVQQFSATGEWVRAFGGGVLLGGATGTGTVTEGSNSITAVATTSKSFVVGQTITGVGIPADTTITAVAATTLTLSEAATPDATGAGTVLTVAEQAGNGDPVNERQTLTLGTNTTGGAFTLSFNAPQPQTVTNPQTTAAIPYNATAAQLEDILDDLTNIGAGNVSVSVNPGGNSGGGSARGGPWTIELQGARYADTDVNQLTSTATALTISSGVKSATVSTVDNGGAGFETCNAATGAICKAGVTGDYANTDKSSANTGPSPGQFGPSTENGVLGVAIGPVGAPNAGELYVSDPSNCRIQRFEVPTSDTAAVSAGAPFGVMAGQEQVGGDVSFFCSSISASARSGPRDIAADINGVVYGVSFAAAGSSGTKRFDTTAAEGAGAFMNAISTSGNSNQLCDSGAQPTSIDIDTGTGRLLLARGTGHGVTEIDPSEKPEQVECGHVVERHVTGMGLATLGIGVGDDRLFVATSSAIAGTGAGQRLLVLDDDGVQPAPIVSIQAPDPVGSTTATFKGNIDPALDTGFKTFYRWQLQRFTGAEGFVKDSDFADATASVEVPPNGFTKSDVTHNAIGLDPNTLYRLRIRTDRNPDAGFAFSANQLFLTESDAPVVETLAPRQVSDISTHLVGRLNPGGLATTYWFEYGEESLTDTVPVPAAQALGGHERQVTEAISGLKPETDYQYRLCAQNSLVVDPVCGDLVEFVTPAEIVSPAEARAYEMVTDPDKPLRRGGERGLNDLGELGRLLAGAPALDAPAFRTGLFAGATSAESGSGWTGEQTYEVYRRQSGGHWGPEAIFNIAPPHAGGPFSASLIEESASQNTSIFQTIPNLWGGNDVGGEAPLAGLRVLDDDGGPRGGGWYPWLTPDWYSQSNPEGKVLSNFLGFGGLLDDERLLSATGGLNTTPIDGGPAPRTPTPSGHPVLSPPITSGEAIFLGGREHDWRPWDLVNECTGTGASATLVPSRSDGSPNTPSGPGDASTDPVNAILAPGATTITTIATELSAKTKVGHYAVAPGLIALSDGVRIVSIDSSTTVTVAPPLPASASGFTGELKFVQNTDALADDRLGTRPCAAGSPVDVRGAAIGGETSGRLGRVEAGAMSVDGRRIFFTSPDSSTDSCEVGDANIDTDTRCPAQLYVRSYDEDGNPVSVRWISRPEDALFYENGDPEDDPAMHPDAALGSGVAFEGASHDGRYVFFRTDAPLLASDPNGGEDRLIKASPRSWDLYRYDLGLDPDLDPASGDPGDRLIRISGGPADDADPNTNCVSPASDCGGGANGAGNALRFLSDDGERAYFVTAARVPGADNTPPVSSGVASVPTGVGEQANATTRNLYYADLAAGNFSFVARLPYAPSDGLVACATFAGQAGSSAIEISPNRNQLSMPGGDQNCVHGSVSGDGIVFMTAAQLSVDDDDAALDIYAYDADAHRLTRLSAPRGNEEGYACLQSIGASPPTLCNGDPGFAMSNRAGSESPGLFGARQWGIASDSQSGDLRSVFFESRLSLTEADQNTPTSSWDGGMDVYRWTRDGRLSLVTPGEAGGSSVFYRGNSLDGRDVYLWTEQPLSPWEIDAADGDIYNATTRTDLKGDPPPPPPTCDVLASACQGPPPAAPGPNRGATSAISGQGNFRGPEAKPKPRCNRNQVRRGNRCVAKRKLAQQRCAKRNGKAKHRCVTQQVRRLNRNANPNRRAIR